MRTSRRWWLVFFLGPAIVLFAAFITYPILSALAFSLYAWEGIGRRGFVGLANFARLFATFPYAGLLVNAFWHNVLVFIATMLLQNVTALGPAVTIIVLLTFIGAFNWFELPYIMQGVSGAPNRATDVLSLLFYRTAFGEVDTGLQDIGIGSAIAVLMFALLLGMSAVGAVLLRRREVELA